MLFLEAPAAKMLQKGPSEKAPERGFEGVFLVQNRDILLKKCSFPRKRRGFVFQKGKSRSKVMLSQKTMMALRPKGPLVARTEILTKHQGQQQEQPPPRGGKPGAGAQPHALFASRGGNLKKFEVYKMSAT